MGRKGGLYHLLLMSLMLSSCRNTDMDTETYGNDGNAVLTIRIVAAPATCRGLMPDEDAVSNTVAAVFDEEGDRVFMSVIDGKGMEVTLHKGREYSIFAFANMDIETQARRIEDMYGLRFLMENPYDHEDGIPMTASVSGITLSRDTVLTLELERLMSKISLRIDRSLLNEGTEMTVSKVRIGNCPDGCFLFRQNSIGTEGIGCDTGFELEDTYALNTCDDEGMSGEISLFMLENMQGTFSETGPASENEKIFDEGDPRRESCSYIEMEAGYLSDSLYCTGSPLIYRLYIGDGLNSLDVERNCHYHLTVKPIGNGLPDAEWRIDKTGLHSFVQEMILSKDEVVLTYSGESVKIEAEVLPSDAYNREMTWKSSDRTVADVDQKGRVTAIGEGTCMVTCRSRDGSGVQSTCLVRCSFAPPHFKSYPEDKYIRGDIGDTVRLWCDVFPPYTPFDIGLDYLEEDKADGIYDFIVDEDGHGVTLILTGPGSGLIYMEAGEPVNEAELYFIEVNLPRGQDTVP